MPYRGGTPSPRRGVASGISLQPSPLRPRVRRRVSTPRSTPPLPSAARCRRSCRERPRRGRRPPPQPISPPCDRMGTSPGWARHTSVQWLRTVPRADTVRRARRPGPPPPCAASRRERRATGPLVLSEGPRCSSGRDARAPRNGTTASSGRVGEDAGRRRFSFGQKAAMFKRAGHPRPLGTASRVSSARGATSLEHAAGSSPASGASCSLHETQCEAGRGGAAHRREPRPRILSKD